MMVTRIIDAFGYVIYAALALLLSVVFTGSAIRVWRDESDRSARRMFAFSLLYLFLIFSLLLVSGSTVSGLSITRECCLLAPSLPFHRFDNIGV